MKTRLLIIIGFVLSAIITIAIISTQSFDTQKYSKENPYGFSAHVIYSKDSLPIMCPTPNDCNTHLQLNIESDIPAILQGYKICNGLSCVSQDNIHFSTKDSEIIPIFDGNKWSVGDRISLKVQVTTLYDGTITHPEPMPFFIDLGESEIKKMVNIDSVHSEPENFTTTLQGFDAKAICSALRIPCPSNPVFSHVTLTNDEYFLTYTTPEDFYEIKLNQTHVCLKSEKFHTTRCDER